MPLRLATRAVILRDDRLLIVNAYGGGVSDLWCLPGGGVEAHSSLPENLAREVYEETGLTIRVGGVCLVNEFHAPDRDFHQVEIVFRCDWLAGELDAAWKDPEQIVEKRQWVTRDQLAALRHKPSSLIDVAWGTSTVYDPLERIVS